MNLLRTLITIAIIIYCCTGLLSAQPWTSIEGGGLNVDAAANGYNLKLESLNGKVHAVWIEAGRIRMKRYDGGTTWTLVDGGGKSWESSSPYTCSDLATAVYNNILYMAWRESDSEVGGIHRIHVMRYDGSSWTFVQSYTPSVLDDGRHYISYYSTGYAYAPALAVHNGKLYASWIDQTNLTFNYQVRCSEFDGTYWKCVDGGNSEAGLNKNYSGLFNRSVPMITMASYAGNLYVGWREYSSVNSSYQFRVKRFNGGSSWTFVDGNDAENGLNYLPANGSYPGIDNGQPRLINYNGYLYAFFSEQTFYSTFQGMKIYQLRWKKYNGTTWANDDGTPQGANGTSGWNKNMDFQTNDPAVFTDNNKLYVSWGETTETPPASENYYEQMHVVDFNGTAKSFIDGNLNTGINYNTSNDARLSTLLIHDGDLYTAWEENPITSAYKLRAKKYPLPPIIKSVDVPANVTYTTGQALNFTVNFSKVVNVSGGTPYLQVTLNTGGTVNAIYISGTGTKALVFRYTVVANNLDNDGISVGTSMTLPGGCTLRSSDTAPLDANLTLSGVGSTSSVLVDAAAPNVTSIVRQSPAGTPTNAVSVIFRVTFDEPVTGVDISDFSLNKTETVNGTIASVSAAAGTTIDVTVNSITGYGTFRLDLKSSGTGITDNAGNPVSGGFTGGETYTTPNVAATFSDGSAFAQNIIPNSSNQVIGRFQLTADVNGAYLTAVSIKLTGTRTGLTNFTLWVSTDADFNSGTDTPIGSVVAADPGDGNSVVFNSFSNAINTSGKYYFLTADVSSSPSGTVLGIIVQNSSLSITTGGAVSGTITNAELSNNSVPLPVELTSFTVKIVNGDIVLYWQTVTEIDNYGFEVEKSVGNRQSTVGNENNPQWLKVGFVNGAGNSNSRKKYSFVDESPSAGNAQYRLKQINTDGSFAYYKQIAEVNYNITDVNVGSDVPTEFSLHQNYPNPFNPTTKIEYSIPTLPLSSPLVKGEDRGGVQEGFVTLKVYNILGKEVATLVNENKAPGNYVVEFNAGNLSSGLYIYKITAGNYSETRKMVLMR